MSSNLHLETLIVQCILSDGRNLQRGSTSNVVIAQGVRTPGPEVGTGVTVTVRTDAIEAAERRLVRAKGGNAKVLNGLSQLQSIWMSDNDGLNLKGQSSVHCKWEGPLKRRKCGNCECV